MTKGFDIGISDGVSRQLAEVVETLRHPRDLFDAIGADLEAEVRLGFVEGSDPYGSSWAHPLWRDGEPLRDTGRLMNSITHNADDSGLEVGTNVMYAATHQFGATIKAKNASRLVFPGPGGRLIFAKQATIPARHFLPTAERGMPAHWWDQVRDRVASTLAARR